MLVKTLAQLVHFAGKTLVKAESSSIDMATHAGLGYVLMANWISKSSSLSWRLTPGQAREYAARIVEAAEEAEKGAS